MMTRLFPGMFLCATLLAALPAPAQPPIQLPTAAPTATSAPAQPAEPAADPVPMSLRDCMAYALSNSTRMRIRQAAVDDARIARRAAILAAFTPQVSGSLSASSSFGRSIDPETNTYIARTSFSNGYGVSGSLTLFDGFSAVNNLRIARTGLLMAQSEVEVAEAELSLAVMEAYYNVVYYERLAEVCAEQTEAAELALRRAERQEELGRQSHAGVVQLAAELADSRYDLIQTRNRCDDQRMTLEALLFWEGPGPLAVDASLAAGQLPQHADEPAADEVLAVAMQSLPVLRIAEGTVEQARRELATARWSLLPSLSIGGGWSTSFYTRAGSPHDPFGAQFRHNGGEYVSASLSIPLFGRLQRQSQIGRRRNALARAEAELDQRQREVATEVRRALQDCAGAREAWLQAQRRAEVQQEAYALSQRQLEQGLISPLEFRTASGNYLRAQADRMNALFQYRIKTAVVRYYQGEKYVEQAF